MRIKNSTFIIILFLIIFNLSIYGNSTSLINNLKEVNSAFSLKDLYDNSNNTFYSKLENYQINGDKFVKQYFINSYSNKLYYYLYKFTKSGLKIVSLKIPIMYNGKTYIKEANIIKNNFIYYNMKEGDKFSNSYSVSFKDGYTLVYENTYQLLKKSNRLVTRNTYVKCLNYEVIQNIKYYKNDEFKFEKNKKKIMSYSKNNFQINFNHSYTDYLYYESIDSDIIEIYMKSNFFDKELKQTKFKIGYNISNYTYLHADLVTYNIFNPSLGLSVNLYDNFFFSSYIDVFYYKPLVIALSGEISYHFYGYENINYFSHYLSFGFKDYSNFLIDSKELFFKFGILILSDYFNNLIVEYGFYINTLFSNDLNFKKELNLGFYYYINI